MERFRLERGEAPAFFRLVGELDVSNAAGTRLELLRELQRHDELTLDATGLTFIDSQGLRMLIELGAEAAAKGTTIKIANCSRSLRKLLAVAVPQGIPGVDVVDAGSEG